MSNLSMVLDHEDAGVQDYEYNVGLESDPIHNGPPYDQVYLLDNGSASNHSGNGTLTTDYNWPVLCLFSIVFMALTGNILVCLSVRMEKKLQNMFNYFLVSLALSDMLSATLVMPLSIIKALIGRYKTFITNLSFHQSFCALHQSIQR